jgi:hypothetical protein
MLRYLPAVALLAATLQAFGDTPVHATKSTSVSPAHCVAALARRESADLLRCPTPLRLAVAEAQRSCRDKGGTLTGTAEGEVWTIDVNGDRRNEYLFALDGNVACADAWNLFSCGTARCPRDLYELRSGMWIVVGSIAADSPQQVTLGATQSADGHRAIEVCARERCAERTIYEWTGSRYEVTPAGVRENAAP